MANGSMRRVLVTALASLALLASCVASDHRLVKRARAAYDDCLSRHDGDSSACQPEQRSYNVAVDRYEQNARRAWSCDPAQHDCPTPH